MKEIIIDVMNETAEISFETKGFKGKTCVSDTEFLKKALGNETESKKKPEYYEKEKVGIGNKLKI